jgi:hypothetical protein
MSVRVQVILEDTEAEEFRSQAKRTGRSLSGWLREAGRKQLAEESRRGALDDPEALRAFFAECADREEGREPDWPEHKRVILGGMQEAAER